MPGFLDRLKSGADKAAFAADRLRRLTQAQTALRGLQHELETQVAAIGQQALALYDARTLTQPELLALFPPIDGLRQQIVVSEAEVERIRDERAPDGSAETMEARPAVPQAPPAMPAPASPVAAAPARPCPGCGAQVPTGVRFCPECGTKVDVEPAADAPATE